MRRRRACRRESVPVKLSFACHMVRHDTYNTQNYCFLLKNTQKNSKTFPHEGFRPMPGSLLGYLDGCFLGCGACRCLGLFRCSFVLCHCFVFSFYCCVWLCCGCCLLLCFVIFVYWFVYILLLYSADLFHCLVFAFYCCVYLFCCLVSLLPKFVM